MAALDIEGLATALAHVRYFPRKDQAEVLRRLGVEYTAFLEAARTLPQQIAEALSAGDKEPARRFEEALQSTKSRLESEKPTLDAIGPDRKRATAGRDGDLDTTLAPPSAASQPTLPFRAPTRGESPAILRHAPPALVGEARYTMAGGTLDPAPAMSPEESAFASWTIERYAAFSAERRRGEPEQVRRAFGVAGPEAEQALMQFMNRRFAQAPLARDRWQSLVAAHLAGASRKGG